MRSGTITNSYTVRPAYMVYLYSAAQKPWSKVLWLKPRLTQPLTTFFWPAEYMVISVIWSIFGYSQSASAITVSTHEVWQVWARPAKYGKQRVAPIHGGANLCLWADVLCSSTWMRSNLARRSPLWHCSVELLLANLVNAPLTLNKRFSAIPANEDGCAGCLKIF